MTVVAIDGIIGGNVDRGSGVSSRNRIVNDGRNVTRIIKNEIASRRNIRNRGRTSERNKTGTSKDKIDNKNNTMNMNRILLVTAIGVG